MRDEAPKREVILYVVTRSDGFTYDLYDKDSGRWLKGAQRPSWSEYSAECNALKAANRRGWKVVAKIR